MNHVGAAIHLPWIVKLFHSATKINASLVCLFPWVWLKEGREERCYLSVLQEFRLWIPILWKALSHYKMNLGVTHTSCDVKDAAVADPTWNTRLEWLTSMVLPTSVILQWWRSRLSSPMAIHVTFCSSPGTLYNMWKKSDDTNSLCYRHLVCHFHLPLSLEYSGYKDGWKVKEPGVFLPHISTLLHQQFCVTHNNLTGRNVMKCEGCAR